MLKRSIHMPTLMTMAMSHRATTFVRTRLIQINCGMTTLQVTIDQKIVA